jgi:hypothetical protein
MTSFSLDADAHRFQGKFMMAAPLLFVVLVEEGRCEMRKPRMNCCCIMPQIMPHHCMWIAC